MAEEETIDEFRTRIIQALMECSLYDDFYDFPPKDPGEAYQAAMDRAIMMLRGQINSWLDPLPLSQDI